MKLKKIFALALAVCMMVSVMPTTYAGEGYLSLGNDSGSSEGGVLTSGGVLTNNTTTQPRQTGVLTNDHSNSGGASAPSVTTRAPGASSSQTYDVAPVDEGEDDDTPAQRVENAGVETIKELKKDASGNPVKDADGNYIIRLEAYVTGTTTTTTTTTTTPMDIVLVLDQSGSMAYDFSGDSTSTNTDRRQYAMKLAVNNFIDKVAEQYDADTADHRMAIVTFGSSASTLESWTFMNSDGQNTLKGEISGLPDSPSGATNVAAGMTQAQDLLDSAGADAKRQKVVIVFTDGVPTTSTDFDTTVATNAIAEAKTMKDNGVKVYTIGIFNGVDKNQLYGEKWDYEVWSDITCSGEVGSYWGGSWLNSLIGSNDFAGIDIAAGNRFLNYLSSNFPEATRIGVDRGTYHPEHTSLSGGTGYEITHNFERGSSDYYLTATDASSLNAMFTQISQTIQSGSATVKLDSTTTVTDVVSDYFKLPEGVDANTDIKVYTAAYTSAGTWGADEPSSLEATITGGDTITVSGFDFSANYCDKSNGRQDATNPNKPGNFYGRKLIIEIPIVVSDDFLGGEDIPTNTTGSQIKNGDTVFEEFESPTIDIPVDPSKVDLDWGTDVTVADQTIYLTNAADLRAMVSIPGSSLIDGINNKFVTVSFVVGNATYTIAPGKTTGTWSGTYSVNPRECTDYTVTCYINGQAVTNNGESNTTTATVHVLKPSAEFLDTTIYLSDTPDYDDNKATADTAEVIWTDITEGEAVQGTVANVVGGEPGMDFICTPSGDFTDCTAVDVDIKIAGDVEFEDSFMVHVLKPTVTVKDSTIYLGETPDYDSENMTGSIRWNDENDDESGEVIGEEPDVDVTFVDPADFNVCHDISVESVQLNGSGNYVDDTTVKNGDKDYFTVHVVKPVFANEDTTIYLGNSINLNSLMKEAEMWECEHGEEMTKDAAPVKPSHTYSANGNSTGTQIVSPTACTTYTVVTKVGSTVVEAEDSAIEIHVVKPVITSNDITIYLSNTVDLNAQMNEEENWVCDHTGEAQKYLSGEYAPSINYRFDGVNANDEDKYLTADCTEITVSATVSGGTSAPIDDDDASFMIHVLKPSFNVTCTDLWADYLSKVDLDGYDHITLDGVTWSDMTAGHTASEEDASNKPVIQVADLAFAFDTGTDGSYTLDQTMDKAVKVTSATWEWADENEYEETFDTQPEFTIHVNKFDLTIEKTWDGTDIYKQDAIFTVKHETLGNVQVILPTGEESITVSNLLCGQTYTVTEDDAWTWRWESEMKDDIASHSHGVSTEAPTEHSDTSVTFENSLINRLWLSFCTFVRNIFGQDAIQKGGSN